MKFLFCILLLIAANVQGQDSIYQPQELIYGRKDGMALTLVHMKPTVRANNKAIIKIISGNWVSGIRQLPYYADGATPFLQRGYAVFLVMHGSQPRYAIPDQVADAKRAIRFIRYHAERFNIDAGRIGITGSSSGGNLSLLAATTDEEIDSLAKDPIDRISSRVQAVAVFYPPTDFLNWGKAGTSMAANEGMLKLARVQGAFEFTEWNEAANRHLPVTDAAKKIEMYEAMSPVTSVSADDPPIFIVHGDADKVVPIQQSLNMIARLQAFNVPHQFIIKKGGGHGWRDQEVETALSADWFDTHLK